MKTVAGKCRKETDIMFSGKFYRSICVILALGGVLYLFMATRVNNEIGGVGGVVFLQPVPTDVSQRKTIAYQMHQLRLSSANGATAADDNVAKLPSSHKNDNDQARNINIPTIDEINSSISVKVNRIVKVTSKQSSDVNANLSKGIPDSKTENTAVLSEEKIVIIIAYMRTGSTLTASLFQEYPDTFYVFEPIRALTTKFKDLGENQTTFHYLHGVKRNYTSWQSEQVIIDEVSSWLTCKLDSISNESLTDDFHKYYTKIMKNFYYCSKGPMSRGARMHMRVHPRLRQYYNRARNIDICLKTAISSCQKSPLKVLKFIRFRMKEAAKLLSLFPNMKIIHLHRDPRGILNSRIKVKAVAPKVYKENVQDLCTNVKDDLKYSKRILQQYPDRLKIVQYEDMAEKPMETARSILDFAGVEFLKNMQIFLHKQTSSSRDTCAYCTQRRNSSLTAHKWRTQLEPRYANFIYEMCHESNSVLGYLPFTSVNAMRNQSINSRQSVDVNKELLTNENF